jgi:hypothetical protein
MSDLLTATRERLTSVETRQAELEARIAALERQALEQVQRWMPWTNPVYPYPSNPSPQWPNGSDDARCHVCGNRWADMTHYVCGHPQCPSRITYGTVVAGQTPAPLSYPLVSAETPDHLKGTTPPPDDTDEPRVYR